jgi:hypothetical protein
LIFVGIRDTVTPEAIVRVLFDGMKQSKKRFISVDVGEMDAMLFPKTKAAYKSLLEDVRNSK